jgi:hypothetical protein
VTRRFRRRHETLLSVLVLVAVGIAVLAFSWLMTYWLTGIDVTECVRNGGYPVKTLTPPFIRCATFG